MAKKTAEKTTPPAGEIREEVIPIGLVRMDGDTQARVSVDDETVEEYAELMAAGTKLPPLEVFHDGEHYWLWDGFHRLQAAYQAELTVVRVNVRQGSLEDAQWSALGANKDHGKRRTNADKRRAAEIALRLNAERKLGLSDNLIAQHCGVSQPFIGKVRAEATYNGYKSDGSRTPRTGADGRTINTANIGKSQPEQPEPTDEPVSQPQADDSASSQPANDQPEPAAPAKQPAPSVDAWGIPIQPHAEAAFADTERFKAAVATLQQVARDLSDLADSPGGRKLLKHMQWERSNNSKGGRFVFSHLENAMKVVKASAPQLTDCPYAFNGKAAHPENCTLCGNDRWVGSVNPAMIPPEASQRMKEHYGVAVAEEGSK